MTRIDERTFEKFSSVNLEDYLQDLKGEKNKVGNIISNAISIEIRDNFVTKEMRTLNKISAVNYDESVLKLHFASSKQYNRGILINYIPDIIPYHTNDIKLIVEYDSNFYYILVRGIYSRTRVVSETSNFKIDFSILFPFCESLIGVGVTVFDLKSNQKIFFKLADIPKYMDNERFISIIKQVINCDKFESEYSEIFGKYNINTFDDLKNVDSLKIYYAEKFETTWVELDLKTDL